MKQRSPAFQFYPADWLGSQRVQLLTLEEEGAYIRLLGYCWLHGSIPSDPAAIAKLIGKGASTTLATTVSTMFQPAGSNLLVHDRLEAERTKQQRWREKSSDGGKKSAKKRAATRSQTPSPEHSGQGSLPNGAKQKATLPSSSSSSSSDQSLFPDGEDRRHHDVTKRWGELYQGAFGAGYGFSGRDAASLKRFLPSVKDSAEEILTVAVQAWERAKQDRFTKRCKEAATIHGLCTWWNDIRLELKTPNHATNGTSGGRGFEQRGTYAGVTDK